MQGKSFSLQKRKRKNGGIVYYVQFKNDDGTYTTAKSTGQNTKGKATEWAVNYLQSGQIITKQNIRFKHFAKDFFSKDGEHAKNMRLRGKRISDRQLDDQTRQVELHLIPFFGEMKLSKIDYEDIVDFQRKKIDEGKSGSTVNHLTSSLKIILTAAYKKKLIRNLPLIERVVDKPEHRGILTPEEVKKLFAVHWPDKRCYVANMLAACTGLRKGEILALKRNSVQENYIAVEHSYDAQYGLKETTKTGRSRYVPIPKNLKHLLSQLLKESPWKDENAYIFFSHKPDEPIDGEDVKDALYAAMAKIGIKQEERVSRFVDFHSWRHFFNSILINKRIPLQKVQAMTGHSTAAMTQNYYHADEFKDVLKIQETILN